MYVAKLQRLTAESDTSGQDQQCARRAGKPAAWPGNFTYEQAVEVLRLKR